MRSASGTTPAQSITQDANGLTSADIRRQYSYDIRDRLSQTRTTQGSTNYEFNAQGLRVRKQSTVSNGDTLYHYDLAGHLLGESTTGTAQLTREYIWLDDVPVAVLQ